MIEFHDYACLILQDDEIKNFSCGTSESHKEINQHLTSILDDDRYALKYRTIVAMCENKVVGFVTFRLKEVKSMKVKNKTKYVPQDSFYVFAIEYLGIDSAYQRQGIGTKLLILMFRTAVTTYYLVGCSGIYVESLRGATDFYESLGFEYLKEDDANNPCCPFYQMAISIHTLENGLNITPFWDLNEYAQLEIP